MVFSSIVFFSVFLPLTLGGYYLVGERFRNRFLLVASLLFYAWGDFRYLGVMLSVVFVNYFGALVVDALPSEWRCRRTFAVSFFVLLDLLVLGYFKYFDFLCVNLAQLFSFEYAVRGIVLPLGISFYTFQGLSYLIDVYRGEAEAQTDLVDLALFITFFPQLIAGPILKYHDLAAQITAREESLDRFVAGVRRFMIGFARKVLIANTLGIVADTVFGSPVDSFGSLVAWGGAIAYSLQLYFDFSGYSDMAIGLGKMFGFEFLENFNYPYVSSSVTEFWRRWHISLSTWFKEYLYIPLGGNRVPKGRVLLNLLVVFLATGVWHGAEWTFFAWGALHGLFILMEKMTGLHKLSGSKVLRVARHVYLLVVVVFAWVLFRSESISYALAYWLNMMGRGDGRQLYDLSYYFPPMVCAVMAVAIPLSCGMGRRLLDISAMRSWPRVIADFIVFSAFGLSLAFLAGGTYNPFIYFRF